MPHLPHQAQDLFQIPVGVWAETGGGVLEHRGQARTEAELETIIKELASMGYSIYSWNKRHSLEQGMGSVGNVR